MSSTQPGNILGSFSRNLFGAIAGASLLDRISPGVDFIPLDGTGKTLNVSGKGMAAAWMGLKSAMQQKHAYEFCYPVAAVCDRLAEADTTGKLYILRAKGKGKDDEATSQWANSMRKLLAQPNVMQTWEQFRGQQMAYKKIFGYCPVLPILRAGFDSMPMSERVSSMINIPPWCFEPIATGNIIGQSRLEDIVKHYKVTLLNHSFELRPDQLFILTDSYMQNENKGFLVPMSRLCGLDMAVSNLCAAMEADNIMLRRSGPAGVLSPGSKDGLGTVPPYTEEERMEVQQDLSNYGVTWSQFQFMVSRNPINLQSIGFNAKQLGSKETIRAAEEAICHRYNYSYILYKDSDATYANQSGAHKSLYQNNVIPNALKDMGEYNKFFKSEENNCIITLDYSHLPILQENRKEAAEASKAVNESCKIAYDNNLITINQWLTQLELDGIGPEGDKRKGDNTNTDPLAIRLGVGGTQALVEVLANTVLDRDSKVNSLEILFGLTPAQAAQMVPEDEEPEDTDETQSGGAETSQENESGETVPPVTTEAD